MKKTRREYLIIVVVFLLIAIREEAYAQSFDACTYWIKVYGTSPAIAKMTFGNRIGNSFGLDTATSFPMEYREQEPPPHSPGFDCVWKPIRPGQFGTYRGLLERDFRGWYGYFQRDTFKLVFSQIDNSSAPISLKWPDASYLSLSCQAMVLKYIDPTNGPTDIDMFARDSLWLDAAGDNGITSINIYKTGTCSPEDVDE